MNRTDVEIAELQGRLAVVRAFKDGRKTEMRRRVPGEQWRATVTPVWNWAEWEYRVAREPEELFITVQGDVSEAVDRGGHCVTSKDDAFIGGTYESLSQARNHVADWGSRVFGSKPLSRVFKLVEVVE